MTKERFKSLLDHIYRADYDSAVTLMEAERDEEDLNSRVANDILFDIMRTFAPKSFLVFNTDRFSFIERLNENEIDSLDPYLKTIYKSDEKIDDDLFVLSYFYNQGQKNPDDNSWKSLYTYLFSSFDKSTDDPKEFISKAENLLGSNSPYLLNIYLKICEFCSDYEAAKKAYDLSSVLYGKESMASIFALSYMLESNIEDLEPVLDALSKFKSKYKRAMLLSSIIELLYEKGEEGKAKEYLATLLEMINPTTSSENREILYIIIAFFSENDDLLKIILLEAFRCFKAIYDNPKSDNAYHVLNDITSELEFDLYKHADLTKAILDETEEGTFLHFTAKVKYGISLSRTGKVEEAFEVFKGCLEEAKNNKGEDSKDVAFVKYFLSKTYNKLGNTNRGARYLREAARLSEKLEAKEYSFVKIRMKYAKALQDEDTGDLEAQKMLLSAYSIINENEESKEMDLYGEVCHHLGLSYDYQKEPSKAYKYFFEAYEYYLNAKGENDEDTLIDMAWSANELYEMGKYKEALDLSLKCYEINKATFIEDDDTLHTLFIAAKASFMLEDYNTSLKNALYVLKKLNELENVMELSENSIEYTAMLVRNNYMMLGLSNKAKAIEKKYDLED